MCTAIDMTFDIKINKIRQQTWIDKFKLKKKNVNNNITLLVLEM